MIMESNQIRQSSLLAAGAILGVLLGACASAPPSESQSRLPPQSADRPAGQGSTGQFDEVVVTANRRAATRNEAAARADEMQKAAAPEAARIAGGGTTDGFGTLADAALARVRPGEEVWIIAQPSDDRVPIEPTSDAEPEPGSGALMATLVRPDSPRPEPEQIPLPLEHTEVTAHLVGYVGTVDVMQRFENPFDEKIEAVYLFPLPEKAAVSEFVMTIGERHIRGILREREEAEQIYADARAQGYQASLLTQHRPNIFEQKVANIEPGKRIDVDIRYFQTLAYRDGWYSFVFPTVVGPRYNPPGFGDPVAAVPREDVRAKAQGTAIRYLAPHERSGYDISITVDIDAGVAIEGIRASHAIDEMRADANTATIRLANRSTIPNRDFVLDFKVTGERVKSNLLTYRDPQTGQGYFTLMMYPPQGLGILPRQPMEMVFVLDCSGSMNGRPIAQAKDAVLEALDRLRPDDTFQIIRFSNNASRFGPGPVPATPENLRTARAYVRSLAGNGGTQMIEGVRAALGFPHDPRRLRFVTFLTDGYIGNEAEIIAELHNDIGTSRIFSFGVGSSVNRYLLERMASEGRGAVAYLGIQDSGSEIMNNFFERISHPALANIEIEWGQMSVSEIYPEKIPDLFVGRPVVITGKYAGQANSPLVGGLAGGEHLQITLPYDADATRHDFIPNIWARHRIADLADRRTWQYDPNDSLGQAIKATALEYGLMSDYTAFVAVDASQRTAGDHGTTVYQPVPMPDGVRYDTTVTARE
jgi:Ca-activated chloride channel family protein